MISNVNPPDQHQYDASAPQFREQEVDFRSYFYLFLRHLRLILICAIISTAIAIVRIQSSPDFYTSFAQVLISNQAISIGSKDPYYRYANAVDSSMMRQWITSSPVMEKVANLVGPDIPVSPGFYSISFPIRDQIDKGSTQLLVSIMSRADNANDAYARNDALIRAFRSQLLDNQLQQTRESMTWMAERLADQKKKVEEAEARFQEYKQKIMIVTFEDQHKSESSNILAATTELQKTSSERAQSEVQLTKLTEAQSKGIGYSDLAFVSQNIESVVKLLNDWKKLKAQYDDSLKTFKEKHPKVEEIKGEMDTLRSQIENEKTNALTSLQISIQTAKDKELLLKKSIDDFKSSAQEVSQKELQYRILEREVQTNSELYNSLMAELESTDLRGKIESTAVTTIEPPSVPQSADSKQIFRKITLALAVGMILGGALAFLIDFFESTFRTPDDVERKLGVPVVGMIPERE
jgi:uncharacterized protein involved in exopolysaccharide biosynthesis